MRRRCDLKNFQRVKNTICATIIVLLLTPGPVLAQQSGDEARRTFTAFSPKSDRLVYMRGKLKAGKPARFVGCVSNPNGEWVGIRVKAKVLGPLEGSSWFTRFRQGKNVKIGFDGEEAGFSIHRLKRMPGDFLFRTSTGIVGTSTLEHNSPALLGALGIVAALYVADKLIDAGVSFKGSVEVGPVKVELEVDADAKSDGDSVTGNCIK